MSDQSVVRSSFADMPFQALNAAHDKLIFNRRLRVLANHLAQIMPQEAETALDIGCGDGQIAVHVMDRCPNLRIDGVDIMARPITHIDVVEYDGETLPYADKSVDCAMIVDVLHHTDAPEEILREAARVARKSVIIKDHMREGFLAGPTLRAMDWVGNRGHNVVLPYNYLDRAQWNAAFDFAQLEIAEMKTDLGLYDDWASWLCDRELHFVARLDVKS